MRLAKGRQFGGPRARRQSKGERGIDQEREQEREGERSQGIATGAKWSEITTFLGILRRVD